MSPVFLMSPPRKDWSLEGRSNFRSRDAEDVDPARARVEWCTLADAVVDAGGEVLVCPPNPKRKLTGMIYTAEAGEFYRTESGDPRFILPNLSPEHRRREADWIGGFFEGLGIRTVAVDSTWEGQGDAIRGASPRRVVHTYGAGPDARTAASAYEEVAHRLSPEHIQIRFDANPWFHGNTFMNVYRSPDPDRDPAAILLVSPEALPDGEYDRLRDFLADIEVVEISADESLSYDTNALQVEETVLAPAQLSETAEHAFDRLGLKVVHIELGELFEKGGGAPVCLTNRLWQLQVDRLPEHVRWSKSPHLRNHTSA